MAKVNVSDNNFRQTLIDTVYKLCSEYMTYRADAAEIAIRRGPLNREYVLLRGQAAGLMQAAKTLESTFTGDVASCVFIEARTENMLMRGDTLVAIQELRVQAKQNRE